MDARAAAAARTAERILEAGRELFTTCHYEAVSLEALANRAGVTVKTVLRRFGSKDALLLACSQVYGTREQAARAVPVGDIAAVAAVLSERYEATMDLMARYWPLEDRIPAVAEMMARARASHKVWLAEIFAPYLPERRNRRHQRRLAELFGVTEIFVWHSWRTRLGLGADVATEAMREALYALVARWSDHTPGRENRRRGTRPRPQHGGQR